METNDKQIIPVRATHPGVVLKRELNERNIKQKDFAKTLGMAAPNLSELIHGKRNVTEGIAIKLEKALDIPYSLWMNLQARYNYVVSQRKDIEQTSIDVGPRKHNAIKPRKHAVKENIGDYQDELRCRFDEGKAEGILQTAYKMCDRGLDWQLIYECTGLTQTDLRVGSVTR